MKPRTSIGSGFSLVEVALALAVLAFSLLTLIALMSQGVQSYRDAGAQSAMVNLATLVGHDLQVTPSSTSTQSSPQYGFQISAAGAGSSGANTVYMDANGSATGALGAAPTAGSVYRVTVYFFPPASAGQKTATLARILITFPAQADSSPSSSPTMYTDIFQTMVSLNRN